MPTGAHATGTGPRAVTTRRRLLAGVAGVVGATGLAGCSGPFGGDPVTPTRNATPAPVPTDRPAALAAVVGESLALGPVRFAVTGVERVERVSIFGGEIFHREGFEFLVVEAAFLNASDRYVALGATRFDVVDGDGSSAPFEPVVEQASPLEGGVALAPGERWALRLHYRVRVDATDPRLRAVLGVRPLPADRFRTFRPTDVALATRAAEPAGLPQRLAAPIGSVGDPVDVAGLSVHLLDAADTDTRGDRSRDATSVGLALVVAVSNDSDVAVPALVGLGPLGGLSVADGTGRRTIHGDHHEGELLGHDPYDSTVPLARGERRVGSLLLTVPASGPLLLGWTPPHPLWEPGTGRAVNRHLWSVR